ncbi:MAG TPA: hypothetical protein VFD82_07175 [Planctomycetota bacterium]|nr:hypothetical protein [Planctomycetota bacterium]
MNNNLFSHSSPRPRPVTTAAAAFALLALATGLAAQVDAGPRPATRAAQFTLPAGDHDLGALVDLLGQIRKAKIECDLAGLDPEAKRIHLQSELRLDADAWSDVVTIMLRSRDLLLVPAEVTGDGTEGKGAAAATSRVVLVTRDNVKSLMDGAEARDPAEVLARPNQIAMVRSFYDCKKMQAPIAINMSRPFFASVGGVPAVTLTAENNRIVVAGCTDDVACVLRYLRAADGQGDGATPRAPAALPAGPETAWPERDLDVAAFLTETARALGANILWRSRETDAAKPVAAGAPRRLGPAAWYVEATRALRASDIVLVPLDEGRRVFEAVALNGPRRRWATQRARECTAEQVLAKETPIEPVWVISGVQHVASVAILNQLRPSIARKLGLSVGCFEGGLVFWGLSDDVASALEVACTLDVAPPK